MARIPAPDNAAGTDPLRFDSRRPAGQIPGMKRCTRLVPLVATGLLSAACGPYLETHVQSRTAQEVPVRCTQGPLEFSLHTLGARWAEGYDLYACSSRDIQGRYQVLVDGVEEARGEWGAGKTVQQWVASTAPNNSQGQGSLQFVSVGVERPDNARCVASLDEQAGQAAAVTVTPIAVEAGAEPVVAATTPDQEPAPATAAEPAAARVALVTSRDIGIRLDYSPEQQCLLVTGKPFFRITDREWSNQDPQAVASEAGVEITIRVWFVEPNDVEETTFVLDQYVELPSGGDDEWIAHLEKERLEREAEQREWELEWRAEEAERQREHEEWLAHCEADHSDEECWGPGGYDGAVARAEIDRAEAERRALEAAMNPTPAPGPPEPPSEPTPEPHDPEGPPPAPLADPQPPKPSTNAEWVPGYWHWSGFEWGWIAGWWRVPEGDLEAGLTVHAPEAPPPLREETPSARPAPNAVWTAGFWQWNDTTWVWVKGSWQLPPQAAATWRPAEWRIEASGAVFLPGGWRLRVGP
jgi:hypothetical protein